MTGADVTTGDGSATDRAAGATTTVSTMAGADMDATGNTAVSGAVDVADNGVIGATGNVTDNATGSAGPMGGAPNTLGVTDSADITPFASGVGTEIIVPENTGCCGTSTAANDAG